MGSSQSASVQQPTASSTTVDSQSSSASSTSQEPSTTRTTTTDASSSGLTGMDLVNFKCAKKKARYDKCSSDFYQKEFLTGKAMSQADACDDKYQAYRTCVLKGIKIEVWDKQGLPPLKEGSPLLEVTEGE